MMSKNSEVQRRRVGSQRGWGARKALQKSQGDGRKQLLREHVCLGWKGLGSAFHTG